MVKMIDLFRTTLYTNENVELAKSLLEPCKTVLKETSFHEDYLYGKTTFFDDDLLKKHNDKFINFYKYVSQQALIYIKQLKLDLKPETKLKFNTVWISEMYKHGSHGLHTHHGSFLSGNFYIHCPPKSSPLLLYTYDYTFDPFCEVPKKEENPTNNYMVSYKVEEGHLLLWKANVPHSVPQNHSDSRITISFNLNLI
tara:strand:+ start:693 stop:1283 length:591 start_codon:yes stop_codon:yes gene_type:complete